jgi:hypothetical protein
MVDTMGRLHVGSGALDWGMANPGWARHYGLEARTIG